MNHNIHNVQDPWILEWQLKKNIPLFWPGAYNDCYNFYGDDNDDDDDDDDDDDNDDQSVCFHGSSTTLVSRARTEK